MPEGGGPLDPNEELYPALRSVDLEALRKSARFVRMDQYESYFRCSQYEARRYDWDGNMPGHGGEAPIRPGWVIPFKMRRPSVRYDLPRLVTQRLSSMVFGADRFPAIVVDGDEDAQEYARELARVAALNIALQVARDKGGSQGTACMSFAFVEGKPRCTVHNAKHMTVLQWADRYEFRPAAVIESYSYPRTVYDSKTGRMREVVFYYARYWDQDVEIVWDPIPEELARTPGTWTRHKSTRVQHALGFCPVYWCQNKPDADSTDGDSDYEGQLPRFDEINELLSATGKGTKANVDPTLVIKEDPALNNLTTIRKGEGNAIWSKGGAEYLELKGESLKAALMLLAEHKQQALDTAGVVLGDPSMAAKAMSAAALRVLYLPMINEADKLREQYGRMVCQMLRDMLRAARVIGARPPGPVVMTADGQRMQALPTVLLDPRVTEEGTKPRIPGTSERVTLNWPPYFPNTWADIKAAAEALGVASLQKQLISQRTAVENAAPIFGIADVDAELAEMEQDRATDMAYQEAALQAQSKADADSRGERQEGEEP